MLLITFSGLDGAGKSTHIAALASHLESLGYRVRMLAFWNDVVVGTRWREGFVHTVYGSERGVGAPGHPVERRDKNVRRWYLTLARHLLYLLDTLNLCRIVRRERAAHGSAQDVLIMDRYVYDELANLPLGNRLTRAFIQAVATVAPRPDLAYLLDADPEAAVARKPEYSVEFMRQCRGAYTELAWIVGNMTVIPPLAIDDARRAVAEAFHSKLEISNTPPRLDTAPASGINFS